MNSFLVGDRLLEMPRPDPLDVQNITPRYARAAVPGSTYGARFKEPDYVLNNGLRPLIRSPAVSA